MSHCPSTLRDRVRPTRFGEMLRLYRMVRGLSLRDAGRSMSLNPSTLMRIEAGQTFDVKTLFALAQWLLAPEDKAR